MRQRLAAALLALATAAPRSAGAAPTYFGGLDFMFYGVSPSATAPSRPSRRPR